MKVPETREEFEDLVRQAMREEGKSLVEAVYNAADSLTKQELGNGEVRLACRGGCPLCCYQMVTCTSSEWGEIAHFLEVRRNMVRSLKNKARRSWLPYFLRTQVAPPSEENTLRVYRDWRGKPCIFLNTSGKCTIYSVRPIDCRTLTSTKRCTTIDTSEAKRFRFPWETWANNMIVEEEEKKSGMIGTTPLPHWVLTLHE